MLPNHWRELRRMACAADAPKNTASRFLGWMVRWFRANEPGIGRLIAYQDNEVHRGTIYLAAGWERGWTSKSRIRDRSGNRAGTARKYRVDSNGTDVAAASKTLWFVDP